MFKNTSKYFLLGYNVFILLIGLSCTTCACFAYLYPYSYGLYSLMKRSLSDNIMFLNIIISIICGCSTCILFVIGYIAIIRQSEFLLALFCAGLIGNAFTFITIAHTTSRFRNTIDTDLKIGMKEQVKSLVAENTDWKYVWDNIQIRYQCCGSSGAYDYENSDWKYHNNKNNITIRNLQNDDYMVVPKSCCVLINTRYEYLNSVDINNLDLRNLYRCQNDAKSRMHISYYYHVDGCYKKSVDDIKIHTFILILLSILFSSAMIIGFLISFWFLLDMRHDLEIN